MKSLHATILQLRHQVKKMQENKTAYLASIRDLHLSTQALEEALRVCPSVILAFMMSVLTVQHFSGPVCRPWQHIGCALKHPQKLGIASFAFVTSSRELLYMFLCVNGRVNELVRAHPQIDHPSKFSKVLYYYLVATIAYDTRPFTCNYSVSAL